MTDPAFLARLNALRPPARPLVADPACERAAVVQVAACAGYDTATHRNPMFGDDWVRRVAASGVANPTGEVAAQGLPTGWSNPPLWMLDEWRASPGHRAALTNPAASRIGMATGTSPTTGRPYAVAVLAGPEAGETQTREIPGSSWWGRLFGWLGR